MSTEESEERAPSFPAGTFNFYADWKSVTCGMSGGSNPSEQISVRIVVVDEYPDVRGKSILWFGNFSSQKAMDITLKALRAMGWDGKSRIGKPDGTNGMLTGLGGTEFEGVVRHETYQSKTRAKVAFVNEKSAGFAFKEPLVASALDRLNDRVKRHMASTAPREERPAALPPGARPPPQPNTGPARASAALPTGGYQRRDQSMSDEERLRAIDRGQEPPAPSVYEPASDDDIPF